MRENKTLELVTLIYRCFIVFFCICFMANILGLLLSFFQTDYFEFNWKEITLLSLKQGGIVSLFLGLGIWIKARIEERQSSKKNQ
ncbi:hypothetical protein MQ089_04055 [Edwardsiella anguillarum]|uniref:hypothetical protein n=1 Tax=Edwardsiella anguillarum TaxID=1821960 RepID=UPI0024B867D7|nr:hypothetical protein [Edwardsiella anguillarum]WHP81061.1 hypothetical protein MQ090_04035 [Edwardsiella anguillarum]WHQ18562.1 hypothetical protein MQ085_04055 [Edwardsiella anguillarum]WHQ22102.1 hypothetical protein MQ089_04055 [Edwardsiella anguillarum]WHQ25626.1 hypothetical protein MQ094_04055 [Edwardsiella anguillarum]WHQ29148.1 hypothetical protein MQ093_04055 [Edwardsiella anguillarum]